MPRYLVERTFSEPIALPGPGLGGPVREIFLENNDFEGISWVFSFVAPDGRRSFCIYDAPTPEAIRRAAHRNNLPVDRISEIRLLDPYFYEQI